MRQRRTTSRLGSATLVLVWGIAVFLRLAQGIVLSPPVPPVQQRHPSRLLLPLLQLQQSQDDTRNLQQQEQSNTNTDDNEVEFSMNIPDVTIDTQILGARLVVDLTDITCRDLNIESVEVELQAPLANGIPVFLALYNVSISCRADYDYQYLFGSGGGVVDLDAHESWFESQMVFTSPNLVTQPPNSVWFNECNSVVVVDELQFDGDGPVGIVGQALNSARPLVIPMIQDEIGAALCQQIEELENDLAQLLTQFTTQWEPYWQGTTTVDLSYLDQMPATSLNLQRPFDTSMGTLFDILLSEAFDYLSARDDTTGDLEINRLLQDTVLDPVTGDYVVDALADGLLQPGNDNEDASSSSSYSITTPLGVIELELQQLIIRGLGNAIQRLDPITMTGPYTLQTGILLTNMNVALDSIVSLQPGTEAIRQPLGLELPIERLALQVTAVVVTSEDTLGALRLGSLLDTNNIVGCALPGFDKLAVGGIHVDEFVLASTSPFSTSTEWITNIIESNVTVDVLNRALDRLLTESDCPDLTDEWDEATVDWRDLLLAPDTAKEYGASGIEPYGDIAPLLKEYIDSILLETDEDGQLGLIREVIYPLTNSQSGEDGVWALQDDFINVDQDLDLGDVNARFELRLSNVRIENLASIVPPISILQPIRQQAYRTLNAATIGSQNQPLRLGATATFGFSTDDTAIRNSVNIQVELWDASISTTLLLRMAVRYLVQFPLRSLFDINCLASLLYTPELDAQGVRLESSEASLSVEDLQVLLKGLDLDIECISCSSPEVEEISALLKDPEQDREAARAIEELLDWGLGLARDDQSFLQLQIDRFLVEAASQCEFRDEYSPNFNGTTYEAFVFDDSSSDDSSFRVLLVMIAVVAGIVATALGFVTLMRCLVSRRHRMWLKTLPRTQLVAIYAAQRAEEEQAAEVNKASASLFESPHVPVFLRYFVPFLLLGNIGLFLSGHFSLGGSVQMYVKLAGETVVIDNFYKFSIVQSALELWDAGGVELAILIFLFSGVWPYTKLLITVVLWFAPPTRVSIQRRGSILLWLDTLGKWSMVDVFVMIISIVAFRVTIRSPDYSFLTPDFYKIDLAVAPLWGLYANMTAQLVTQFSSHLIIVYHRKVEAAGTSTYLQHKDSVITDPSLYSKEGDEVEVAPAEGSSNDAPIALNENKFLRPHRGMSEPLYLRWSVNPLFVVGSTLLIALLLSGFLLPSFSFENLGIIGVAIEFGQNFEEARREYSISNIAQLLMDQGRFLGTARDSLGHFSIVTLLVFSTLIVPYMLIALLLFQLWYPLSTATRRRVDVCIESLSAWQYVDVYLLSVIVASWQVGDISEYLVNPYCGSLDRTFSELVSYGILDEDDAQCFRVRSRIEPAVYALVAAAVLLSLLMTFVVNAHRHAEYQSGTLAPRRERRASLRQDIDIDDDELRVKIHPVPLLLTDRFRWLFRAEEKA